MKPSNPSRRAIGPLRTALRLGRDKRGVAAVEFALILPLMLLLYVGSSEVTQGVLASRKMSILSRSLADLAAQQPNATAMTDAKMTIIFGAATAIMSPFSTTSLQMVISSVDIQLSSGASPTPPAAKVYNNGAQSLVAIVRWSKTGPTTAGTLSPAPPVLGARDCSKYLAHLPSASAQNYTSFPEGLYSSAGASVIIADVTYRYTPVFGGALLSGLHFSKDSGSIDMKITSYMSPRNWTTYIAWSGTPAPACSQAGWPAS